MKTTSAEFLKSAFQEDDWPRDPLPEIAFLGRSNVGKSSLINSLLGVRGLARTSSTPGCTQSLNFFLINKKLRFVDLPGYGYARVAREISQQWPGFVEPYLRERPCLALCLALVDVNVPPQASDRQLLEFLSASARPFLIVATKSDRLSANQLRNALQPLTREHPRTRIVPYSARLGTGREELWQEIRSAVESQRAARL